MPNSAYHIRVIAPAKLNLNLHIIGLNNDNYHLLEGVSLFTNDGDYINITIDKELNHDKLEIDGSFGHHLNTKDIDENLIIRTLKYVRDYVDCPNIFIKLEKNIPIQAGYGGGSSDAAAFLKAINQLCHLNLNHDTLHEIALKVGADVPMCLYAKPCLVHNIGDVIKPLNLMKQHLYCLLLKPSIMLSTPKVFNMLTQKYNPKIPDNIDNYIDYALYHGRNDLWGAACKIAPILKEYLTNLQKTNPIKATMSGSGSGLFGLYRTPQDMQNAYLFLREIYQSEFIMRTSVNI